MRYLTLFWKSMCYLAGFYVVVLLVYIPVLLTMFALYVEIFILETKEIKTKDLVQWCLRYIKGCWALVGSIASFGGRI